jgi:hypothetical protein
MMCFHYEFKYRVLYDCEFALDLLCVDLELCPILSSTFAFTLGNWLLLLLLLFRILSIIFLTSTRGMFVYMFTISSGRSSIFSLMFMFLKLWIRLIEF